MSCRSISTVVIAALTVLLCTLGLAPEARAQLGQDRADPAAPTAGGGVPSNVWSLFGNRKTDPAVDYFGTSDAQDLVMRTAAQERLRVKAAGDISIVQGLAIGEDLDVARDTSTGRDLRVGNDTTVENDLSVWFDAVIGASLGVSGPTSLDDSLDVGGATQLNGTLGVAGATTLGSTLDVGGPMALDDTLSVAGATSLDDTLVVTGAAAFGDTIGVTGAAVLGDSLDVSGATTVSNTLGVTGSTTLGDTLDVTGDATLGGTVGVNGSNSDPTNYALMVTGRLRTNGINELSDRRLKRDITPLTGALASVLQLAGVRYSWRREEFPELGLAAGAQVGLIAQEVEVVVPEVVHSASDDTKSIEYSHLVPLLIEAVKEQQCVLEAQAAELAELRAAIDGLRPSVN